jgi:hypothetical protein
MKSRKKWIYVKEIKLSDNSGVAEIFRSNGRFRATLPNGEKRYYYKMPNQITIKNTKK